MKLYHGTSETSAKAALTSGLRPRGTRKGNWQRAPSGNDRVYMTTAYALYFAFHAAKEEERWAVLEIDSDLLGPGLLVPDEDFLEQATRNAQQFIKGTMLQRTRWFRTNARQFSQTWKDSVAGLGTCAYLGNISPKAITRVAFFDPKSNSAMAFRALDPTITLLNYHFVGGTYRALIKWLFGDPVQVGELLTFGLDQLSNGAEILKQHEEAMADRSGIEVITTR